MEGGQWGTVVRVFMYSAMIFQFFIGAVTDRIGHKPIPIAGFLITALVDFLIATVTSYSMLILAVLSLGIGAMSLNTARNNIIPQVLFDGKDPACASNFGTGFFGLGFFVTPLVITCATSYNIGLMIMGGLSIVMLILAYVASYPKANINYKFSTGFKLLAQPAVFIAALALMCYVGL